MFKQVTVNELEKVLNDVELIDIREVFEYNFGRVPGAKNIPMNELAQTHTDVLSKDKEYYIICQSGGRSANMCHFLASHGYNVVNVLGGTGSWHAAIER
jgi:rhodanese-related sulfurtransferase